jgi:PQQ-dependent dehydrogenase (methanol/ethanol family)
MKNNKKAFSCAGLLVAACLTVAGSQAQVPAAAKIDAGEKGRIDANANHDDWLLHGRTYDNQRFSPLTQINRKTLDRLSVKAVLHTGVENSFEATPIEVDGVLYIVTATNHVQAYDAVTGEKLWAWQPASLDYTEACCGPQARGVAVAYGKVYTALFDGHLVALDARTGKLVWQTDPAKTHPEPKQYYTYTLAPQVYDGMVIVGTAGAEYETRGMVEAYNAQTGEKMWEFRTTAAPGEPGGDTWGGDAWKFGGGSVWNTPAIDPRRGLVILSTGNPNPDYQGTTRPGDNAYTNSIIALNAKTGKLSWWYQEVPHDMWDYDASAPTMLFDAKDGDGKLVPAAGQAGKVGNVFIVNRETGKLLRKSQPFVTQSDNIFTAPTARGVTILPGVNGGSLWQPPAFSPRTNNFYVLGSNIPMTFTTIDFKDSKPGGPWVGRHTGGVMKRAGDLPQSGTLSAIDVNTGKITWQYKSEQPIYGGVLATASDLVFAGEQNGDFSAFDARDGRKLWSHRFGMAVCSPAITYRVKGVQYIAVGTNGCRGGHLPDGRPAFDDSVAILSLSK